MPIAIRETPVQYRTAPAPLPDEIYTAEDLLGFPSDWHYELIEGYLRPMPMPTGDAHGSCTALFSAFTTLFTVEHGLGDVFAAETGFLIREQPDTIKAPDFAFVAKGRLPSTRTLRFVRVVPELVLETRSPSDREAAVQEKIQEWLTAGVKVVLDLKPAQEIMIVHRPNQEPQALTIDDSFTADEVLPDFSLPLRKIFPQQ